METPPNPDGLVNQDQLARLLGVSKTTVSIWHKQGIISAAIEESRNVRFDAEKVRRELAKRAEIKRKARKAKYTL
jgi:predicted site-specific integrase-resolvase